MKITGEVKTFSKFIASIINEAMRETLPINDKTVNLTEENVCDILLLQDQEKYDNYLQKIAGNRKFRDEDIKAIIKSITNPKGEIYLDEEKLLNNLILGKPSVSGEYPNEELRHNEELMREIRNHITKKLEDALESDFPAWYTFYRDAFCNIRHIVGLYFLHFLRNRIANKLVLSKDEKDLLVDRTEEQEKLNELLENYNMVLITGEHSNGKTSFIKSYAIKDDRDYLMIDWKESADFDTIITSIHFEEDELLASGQIWDEIGPKLDPSTKKEKADVAKERILKSPSKFGLIIDNFDGNAEFLDKLSEFSNCDNDREKIRVIVITEPEYEASYPSLRIEPLNEDQLSRIFERYSGVGDINKDDELKTIMDKLIVQFKGWPELLILAAEAYENHLRKGRKCALDLLKNCLQDKDILKSSVKDREFHSAIDPEHLKLRGHISKVQEKRAGNISKEAFFLLLCLDGDTGSDSEPVPVPEYYFKKLCHFSDKDIAWLSINHWIYIVEGNIYVKFPPILVSSAIKNDCEREQALEFVLDFLTRLGREMQGVEPEMMSTEWILPILGNALNLEKNWSNASFKRVRSGKLNNRVQDFYLCCVRYYIQNFDFISAKKVLDYKKTEDWSDNLAVRVWKAIVSINDESVSQDERLNRYETMLMPLREEVNKLSWIEPECGMAYLTLYEYLLDAIFLNFVFKEITDIIKKQDDAPGNLCDDDDSINSYRKILHPENQTILTEYKKVWEECNKGQKIPYNREDYYDKRMCFITFYSYYKEKLRFTLDDRTTRSLFIYIFQLSDELKQIWGELDRKELQRRDKITSFNSYCDIVCIQIMCSSLFGTMDNKSLYPFVIDGFNWWNNIRLRISLVQQRYLEYDAFLPGNSKVRYRLMESYYATFDAELRKHDEADKKSVFHKDKQ